MATDFIIPSSAELREIEQDLLPDLTAQRYIFEIFPPREVDDWAILWEQKDNFVGLQGLRGIGGAPGRVKRPGAKRYLMEPGVYGEYQNIDENELLRRRNYGSFDRPINISDLVAQAQAELIQRRLDRIEQIGWTLLASGTFSVSTPEGVVAHTDTYSPQTFTATVQWSNASTSTPLMDFRNVKLKHRGHSVRFDASAKAYANSTTCNAIFSNTNNADLYGRRTAGLGTFNSPEQVNQLLTGDNLPSLVEYDEGYLDDSGAFQLYIPNNTVVVVGDRISRTPVGEYQMTRNANNPNLAPGAYMKVIDRGELHVPRSIEVHDGHNGGPSLLFGSAVVIMSV